MTAEEWKRGYQLSRNPSFKNICAYKYVDIREPSKLFISFHIQDVVKRDFLFFAKNKDITSEKKNKVWLKGNPFWCHPYNI